MQSISIGEIQKNISLLTQLSEVFAIVDRRKNKRVAIVYPTKQDSTIKALAGKYRDRVSSCSDLDRAKEVAMIEAMSGKYGLSD